MQLCLSRISLAAALPFSFTIKHLTNHIKSKYISSNCTFPVVERYHGNCTASCIKAVKSISMLRNWVVSMQNQYYQSCLIAIRREPFDILFIGEYKLISSDQTGSENKRGHPPDVFIVRIRIF